MSQAGRAGAETAGSDASTFTRRQVLAAGLAAGAASLTACTTARRAGSTNTPKATSTTGQGGPGGTPACGPPSLKAIEHVVIVIQENRSFDHYFGSYPGVRGFDDHPAGQPGVFAQPAPAGQTGARGPFHLDTATTNASCTNDITHDWAPQHASWNHGAMDGWARAHAAADGVDGATAMGYYTRADLPYLYALADAFTLCDAYHCSVLGPTGPNRMYSVSATLGGDGAHGRPVVATDDVYSAVAAKFSRSWTTMPERLQAQGVSWQTYQQPGFDHLDAVLAISNNPLFYFRQYADPTSELYHNAFKPSWPTDFLRDVSANNLPSVSWVYSPVGQDEHPPSSPQVGAYFTSQVVSALMSNPAVWAKTVLFVTYDENGGFFDHVAPPTAPPGTAGEYLVAGALPTNALPAASQTEPIGLGFRVPMLVVSPFSRGGWVCSDRFDHTSLLRFIETRFGVEVPNLSAWRRSITADLTTALDVTQPDVTPPPLPVARLDDPAVVRECPPNEIVTPVPHYAVPANPPIPSQEPGVARRRNQPVGACAR